MTSLTGAVKRVLRFVVLLVVVGYAALLALALLSDRVIFQAHPSSYSDQQILRTAAQPVELLKLSSGGVPITAVYLPNAGARYTLLFSHGNAEDLGNDLPLLHMLRESGFAVFAYDYRGYGTSAGRPSESGFYADALAAYDYLLKVEHVPPERVIAFGRSLGSAAAIHVASQRPVAGLIAEAPFLSAFRVLTRIPLLPWDKFASGDKIARVRCPVLVIQGRNDEVIPVWHGERMFRLAPEPKQAYWVDGAGHNDVVSVAGAAYFRRLQEFASGLEKSRGTAGAK